MEREAFLARLRGQRRAAASGAVEPAPVDDTPPSLDEFGAALARVGGVLGRVREEELVGHVVELARGLGASFVTGATPRVASLGPALEAAGLRAVCPPGQAGASRATLARAEVGLVDAELGISESGTVVLCAAPDQPRLVSGLPRALIAILDGARLIRRWEELPAWLARRGQPSCVSLISGVSCTGDIGFQLIDGASGPAVVRVVAISS